MDQITQLTRNISSIATKKSALIRSNSNVLRQGYNFSDMHTLDYIGKNKRANVTKIAKNLGMTRGAISKITKRLLKDKHIESYKIATNKKETYFRLTQSGESLFLEHDEIHAKYTEIDTEFFSKYAPALLEDVNQILQAYDEFLTAHADLFTL